MREIAQRHLLPFFSGARLLDQAVASTTYDDVVALRAPNAIAFKIRKEDPYRLILNRSQNFVTAENTVVPEIAVVRAFVEVIAPMAEALTGHLKDDLLSTFGRRIVAKTMSSKEERESTILNGIDRLLEWSARLYEGAPISASIGFRHKPQRKGTPTLDEITRHDFSAVLSNGHDTILEFDFSGRLISHASLPSNVDTQSFCPLRQAPIAEWTAQDIDQRRVGLCLNRTGEVLVFRDGILLFARRSGRWSFLTHEPVLTQMGTPQSQDVRRAVYQTCLDASFARTGACIGVVSSNKVSNVSSIVVDADHLGMETSTKSRSIQKMVVGRKFQELDRRLRQELVAIDGATVLSHEGELLAVGTILKLKGGSTGGGRLAAAKALSALGLGIKVSQDGAISGYRPGSEAPAFQIM